MKTEQNGQTQIVKPFEADKIQRSNAVPKVRKVVPSVKDLHEMQAREAAEKERRQAEQSAAEAASGKPKRKAAGPKKLTHAVKALFKKRWNPISAMLDSIAIDFEDRTPVRKTLIAFFKLKVPISILLAVVIAFSGSYFLLKSDNTATTEMSLNYEESAYGLNPNSTRFNAYDIAGQEVVEKMLEYCGIDPASVDVNEIADCISIRPSNKKAFKEDDLFITTTYRITITNPPEIKGVSTKQLLTFLCKAYKDHLYSNYTENRSILSFDIDRLSDGEYMEIADLLDLKAQQIEKYLNRRVKQSKTFTEKESDESFKSLVQKVEDIREYDIAKYRAFVIEAGCSHDKVRYLRSLSYINRIKDLSYTKDMAAYNVHNDGIKMYNEAMISVVMIPSIDESKKTYYMSKTKTGMDYMASKADDYLETAQATEKEIKTNTELMKKMSAGKNTDADIEKANSMINNIRQKLSDLSAQIETVDKAYVKYKTKDYLTFKTSNPSLLQKLQPTKIMIIAAALLLAIYAALWYRFKDFNGGK